MSIEDYKKQEKIIMFEVVDRGLAFSRFVRLMIIYAQDGALAGEKYYGNNMVQKGRIIWRLSQHFLFIELKEPPNSSPH